MSANLYVYNQYRIPNNAVVKLQVATANSNIEFGNKPIVYVTELLCELSGAHKVYDCINKYYGEYVYNTGRIQLHNIDIKTFKVELSKVRDILAEQIALERLGYPDILGHLDIRDKKIPGTLRTKQYELDSMDKFISTMDLLLDKNALYPELRSTAYFELETA